MFSALGQDTIDALFWTATEPRPNGRRKREHLGVLAHFLLTIVYVILHTLLVLLQVRILITFVKFCIPTIYSGARLNFT